jgi:Queuosine biosynthesis protein QueC
MNTRVLPPPVPERQLIFVEAGLRRRAVDCGITLDEAVRFSTGALESYYFKGWEPVLHDAMVVAGAIEYADRSVRRPAYGWARRFHIVIPVFDPTRWLSKDVYAALVDAAQFLTGDFWSLEFVKRQSQEPSRERPLLPLSNPSRAVMAYSDGMDSRAVYGLQMRETNGDILRVRLGQKARGRPKKGENDPFVGVPYKVSVRGEASARSRGLKFAVVSGLGAYLAGTDTIIVPESGQGVFGPVLATAGHAYPDYRNHPLYFQKAGTFLRALLGRDFRFVQPRLFSTKGETLKAFAPLDQAGEWATTTSCWRNQQWSAVEGKQRQCGVCAACMLRRMSVHAAGLSESGERYICEDLGAAVLDNGIHPEFTRLTRAYREYAIAGLLHLEHMAELALPGSRAQLCHHARHIAGALEQSPEDIETELANLFARHAAELAAFKTDLGEGSFISRRAWGLS